MDLTPSQRPHGAQRMLSATTLTVEALVVFFAALVSHQLNPEARLPVWTIALVTALIMLLLSGMLKRRSWPYVAGAVAQIPMILLGIWVSAMWVIGLIFAVLYVYGAIKGHQLDAEKDAVDARFWEESGQERPATVKP